MEAAGRAAAVVRRRARDRSSLEWRTKAPADFVSDVDEAAEAAIARVIRAELPQATLVGEEFTPGNHRLAAPGITVVADPLDGTTNFLHGYPAFSVSIGVLRDGRPVAGVVINVPHGDRFTAAVGRGTWHLDAAAASRATRPRPLAGRRLAVSEIADPSRALIGTGFPFKALHLLPAYQAQFEAVTRATAGVRRAGSAALDLADVAAGRFDAFWELQLAPWDVAAGILLIREAGGVVTTLDGQDAEVAHGPIVAGNPTMHRWLLRALRANS